jgi:peptide-methionine (S)-S-oxide reductase
MPTGNLEIATLGGGCFWCLEAVYQQLLGVEKVVSGYAGGIIPNPTYLEVCSGRTRHAEVVQITFNKEELTFRELLEVFFVIHDPTTPNRQGADVGTQYRSIILYHSDVQKQTAEALIDGLEKEGIFGSSIVTQIKPLETFWPAEREHQDYYRRNPSQGYCQVVISPKLEKFRETFARKIR